MLSENSFCLAVCHLHASLYWYNCRQARSVSQGLFVFNARLVIGKDKNDLMHSVKAGAWSHFCLTVLVAQEVVQAKARQLQSHVIVMMSTLNLYKLKKGCIYNDNKPSYESHSVRWGYEAEWYLLFLQKCALQYRTKNFRSTCKLSLCTQHICWRKHSFLINNAQALLDLASIRVSKETTVAASKEQSTKSLLCSLRSSSNKHFILWLVLAFINLFIS